MPHPRRSPCRTASAAILARRREHARQRLQKGAELTFDERRRIADLLARLGREAENIEDDLASIQHSIAHYWLMLVRMAEDNSSRLDRIASLAAELGEALAEPYQHWPPVAEADPEWVRLGQIEAQARDARRRTSGSRRGNQPEFELRWLLVGLSSIWERRLGREHQPRSTKRGTLSDFVSSIVAIADPPLPIGTARSVLSMIRKSKKAPEFFAAPIRRNKH